MWKSSTDPVPGVVRIAPDTMEIAQGGTHKYRWNPRAFSFALYGVEYLWLAAEQGEL